jgi:hypothetical protein
MSVWRCAEMKYEDSCSPNIRFRLTFSLCTLHFVVRIPSRLNTFVRVSVLFIRNAYDDTASVTEQTAISRLLSILIGWVPLICPSCTRRRPRSSVPEHAAKLQPSGTGV